MTRGCARLQNVQHDTTIFSLASLLCSTLIFNGGSTIDEASIQACSLAMLL
jgi:hypothetical protein